MGKNKISNDKSNELAITITSICRDLLQKENVTGIYLNSFIDEQTDKKRVQIVFVVDEMTDEWKSIKQRQYNSPIISSNIHNIMVYVSDTSVVTKDKFVEFYMTCPDMNYAKELKNSHIIYDKRDITSYRKPKLTSLQKSFKEDNALPMYKNRLEISPTIIRKIQEGILNREPIKLTNNIKQRIVNRLEYPKNQRILQIKALLKRYDIYEMKNGYPNWNFEEERSEPEYIVCSPKNLKLFKEKLKETTIYYDCELENVFSQMEKTDTSPSKEDKIEFFKSCLDFLEKDFVHGVVDYLDDREKEIYQKLSTVPQKQKKIRK